MTQTQPTPIVAPAAPPRRARGLVALARTLHVYLTMLGLGLLLFFSLTGFMLNHSDWFGLDEPRTSTLAGTVPAKLLGPLDKLMLVEELRARHAVTGRLDSFDTDDSGGGDLRLVFKRPGCRTEATIGRTTGKLELSIETHGPAGWLTDLHKGASASAAWHRCLDAAAILLFVASLTGVVLWLSVPKRRKLGIAALLLGIGLCAAVYALMP